MGVAPTTAAKYVRTSLFWRILCGRPHRSGPIGVAGTLPADEEEAALELFALHCVHFPRLRGNQHITGECACSRVAAVCEHASLAHERPACT
jgi:hypothetical protein